MTRDEQILETPQVKVTESLEQDELSRGQTFHIGQWQSLEESQFQTLTPDGQDRRFTSLAPDGRHHPSQTRWRSNSLIPDQLNIRGLEEKHFRSNSLTPLQHPLESRMETLQLPGRRYSITSDSSAISSASSLSDIWAGGPEMGERKCSPQFYLHPTSHRAGKGAWDQSLKGAWDQSTPTDSFSWHLRDGTMQDIVEDAPQMLEENVGMGGLDPPWNIDNSGLESNIRRSSTMSDYDRRCSTLSDYDRRCSTLSDYDRSSGIESDIERRFSDGSHRKSGSFSLEDRRRSSTLSWDPERVGGYHRPDDQHGNNISEDCRRGSNLSEDRRRFSSISYDIRSNVSEDRRDSGNSEDHSSLYDERKSSHHLEDHRGSTFEEHRCHEYPRRASEYEDLRWDCRASHGEDENHRTVDNYFDDRRGSSSMAEDRRQACSSIADDRWLGHANYDDRRGSNRSDGCVIYEDRWGSNKSVERRSSNFSDDRRDSWYLEADGQTYSRQPDHDKQEGWEHNKEPHWCKAGAWEDQESQRTVSMGNLSLQTLPKVCLTPEPGSGTTSLGVSPIPGQLPPPSNLAVSPFPGQLPSNAFLSLQGYHTRGSHSLPVSPVGPPPDSAGQQTSNISFARGGANPGTIKDVYNPGMRNLADWLKTLRLHKYAQHFHNLSYHQLINLNEDHLARLNITKGARRKILTSVQKLRERPDTLKSINNTLEKGDCDLRKIIADLEILLKSPMPAQTVDDLPDAEISNLQTSQNSDLKQSQSCDLKPSQPLENKPIETDEPLAQLICTTLRKVCTNLLLSPHTDATNVSKFVGLLDVSISCPLFSTNQKQLLSSWKLKIRSIWNPAPLRRSSLQYSRRPAFFNSTTSQTLGRRLSLQGRNQLLSGSWASRGQGRVPLIRSHTTILDSNRDQPGPHSFQPGPSYRVNVEIGHWASPDGQQGTMTSSDCPRGVMMGGHDGPRGLMTSMSEATPSMKQIPEIRRTLPDGPILDTRTIQLRHRGDPPAYGDLGRPRRVSLPDNPRQLEDGDEAQLGRPLYCQGRRSDQTNTYQHSIQDMFAQEHSMSRIPKPKYPPSLGKLMMGVDARFPGGKVTKTFLADNPTKDDVRHMIPPAEIRLPGVPEDMAETSGIRNFQAQPDLTATVAAPFQIVISSPAGCSLQQQSQYCVPNQIIDGAGPAQSRDHATSEEAKQVLLSSEQNKIDNDLESICMSVTRHALE